MIPTRRSLLTGALGAAAATATAAAANAGPRALSDSARASAHALLPQPDPGLEDTANLQAEIDRAAADGRPLLLAAGTYRTGTLTLPAGTVLIGAHGLTRLKTQATALFSQPRVPPTSASRASPLTAATAFWKLMKMQPSSTSPAAPTYI